MLFGLQPIHIIAILLVALIIFGPSRLPEIGRGLGKAITEFKRGTHEMTASFREEVNQPSTDQTISAVPPASQPMAANPANTNFCTSCGAANPVGAGYCNKCGTQLPS